MATICVQRGQFVRWRLTYTENDLPIDITGWTWEVLESKIDNVQINVTDGVNGISELTIAKEDTTGIKTGFYTLRSRLIPPDGIAARAHKPIQFEVT